MADSPQKQVMLSFGPEQLTRPQAATDVTVDLRVTSPEYGPGTVVLVSEIGIQVEWDQPIEGEQRLLHDAAWVAGLERL